MPSVGGDVSGKLMFVVLWLLKEILVMRSFTSIEKGVLST
jgi:hypothetical protein